METTEANILLNQLKSLLARAPAAWASYSPTSTEHQQWLGQAHALVIRWNVGEATGLRIASNLLMSLSTRNDYLAQIFGILHRAVADLELQLSSSLGQAFGPGAIYDFFKALNKVLSSAQKSILVVDPYIDDTVFDTYLSSVPKGIRVRLLCEKYSAKLKPAAERYIAQYGALLDVKRSKEIHDRLAFVDDECWVMGQSIKDAAASKPTYLAPLSPDIAVVKLAFYENIWLQATQI